MRKFLEHVKGWSWWTGSKSAGEIVPYGLWRLPEAREAGYIILTEGETDTWTCWLHGFPALGIPGADMTGKLKAEHLEGIPKIFISQDGDPSGEGFVKELLKRLEGFSWQGDVRVVLSYPHKDPNEFHCADPESFKEAFAKVLEGATGAAKPVVEPPPKQAVRIELVDSRVFLQRPSRDDQPYLIEGLVPAAAHLMFNGRPKSGKSHSLLQVAFDAASDSTSSESSGWFAPFG
jgi:hypothetical protein